MQEILVRLTCLHAMQRPHGLQSPQQLLRRRHPHHLRQQCFQGPLPMWTPRPTWGTKGVLSRRHLAAVASHSRLWPLHRRLQVLRHRKVTPKDFTMMVLLHAEGYAEGLGRCCRSTTIDSATASIDTDHFCLNRTDHAHPHAQASMALLELRRLRRKRAGLTPQLPGSQHPRGARPALWRQNRRAPAGRALQESPSPCRCQCNSYPFDLP